MFDIWKTRYELCKAYKIYNKKAKSLLYSYSYSYTSFKEYKQLQDIQYAIAYVLCKYFDFNYKFYYDDFPFSDNKWCIAYDYIYFYDECKRAYENITKQNKTNNIAWSIDDFKNNHYTKGDMIYNMENGCLYMYDGKNFLNMC